MAKALVILRIEMEGAAISVSYVARLDNGIEIRSSINVQIPPNLTATMANTFIRNHIIGIAQENGVTLVLSDIVLIGGAL